MKIFWTILAAAVMAGTALAQPAKVTLVKDGEPQCTLVISVKPSGMTLLAASELQWHIEQITGAKIPVVRDGEHIKGLPIYIGDSTQVKALKLASTSFADREFAVQFLAKAIVLNGSESSSKGGLDDKQPLELKIAPIEMGPNRGPLFATYEFIENVLGVRWYAPGNENISWPKKSKTLAIDTKSLRRTLAIRERNTAWGVNAKPWGDPEPSEGERNLFKIRNKAASGAIISHSFEGWPDRFYHKNSQAFEAYHPEYFSKDQNEGQLCFTSEGTIAQAVKDARRWADGKGGTLRACTGEDWYGLEPRDTDVRCTCPTCKPLLGKREGFNSSEASVIVWGFADKVARELQKTNPGKSVGVLAYGNHAGCPTQLDLATNIYVGMAVFQRGTPDPTDPDWQKFHQWSAKLPGRMHSVWLYPCFPRENAGIRGFTAFPKFEAHGLNKQMRIFAHNKVNSFMFCGAYDTVIDFWASVKFQDNPFVDCDALIHEFFQRYYGAAAVPMEKLYNGIESASEGVKIDEKTSWDVAGTTERMNAWQKLMDEATALASTDLEKKRVANVRENLWAEMLKGKKNWDITKQYADDVAAFRKLPPMDTNVIRIATTPAGEDAANVDWKNVNPVRIFRTMSGYPAVARTADLYMAHDGKNLYIRLVDNVDGTKANDSGCSWWGDRWEIFLCTQRNTKAGQRLEDRKKGEWGPYRQISLRPANGKPDMWTSEFDGPFNVDWQHWPKVDLKIHNVKSSANWSMHMTIPLNDISVKGPVKPGEWVYFNFIGQNNHTGDVLALSPTFDPGAYHNVPRMAGFRLDP